MDSGRVSNWLQIAANLGIIVGLILVALQMKQSSEIARAQLLNDYYLADMQLELSMMGESPVTAWTKAVYAPDELSREEAAIVDRYFNYGMVQLNRLAELHKLDLANEQDWIDRVDYLYWHLGNEAGKRWWSFNRSFYPEPFAEMVDEALSDSQHTPDNKSLLDAMVSAPQSK